MKYIVKFNHINESKFDIESVKKQFSEFIEEYKTYLLKNIKFTSGQVEYIGFDTIDIEKVLDDIKQKFGEKVIDIFNVDTFLRKLHQIIELKKLNIKKVIRFEFAHYNVSLDLRVKEWMNSDPINVDAADGFDNLESEKSLISRKKYERENYNIQIELLKLQEWIMKEGKKVIVVCEGRDAAGKGTTIKAFVEYLQPKGYKVVALGMPTPEEKENWFQRYEKELPNAGQIAFFDRSWYNRAVVEPALGYCTEEQYMNFMNNVNSWEGNLIKQGYVIIKLWFSVSKEKQLMRFQARQNSPLKYWKFSPNDEKVIGKWDIITNYKNQMFSKTSTPKAPWVIINSNDKKIRSLNAMRYFLSRFKYPDKKDGIDHYYTEVVYIVK